MKISYFKTALLQTSLVAGVVVGLTACSNNLKAEEANETAKEQSEAQFESANSKTDAEFLMKAAGINLEEIQLGQLAQQKCMLNDVKELGKMMEVEHTQCLKDLTALAEKKSITLPTTLTMAGQEACKKLGNLSGAPFDKAYCDMMVNGHKAAIAMFDEASLESSDTDIKTWAAATLPALHKHLDHALMCQKECEKKCNKQCEKTKIALNTGTLSYFPEIKM